MSNPKLTKSCAGGCGTEVEIPEAAVKALTVEHASRIPRWCQACAFLAVDEARWEPLLTALTRNPALAAKVRKALGEE